MGDVRTALTKDRLVLSCINVTAQGKKSLITLGYDQLDRLVGLVVKASTSRAEGPGFESRLRRDFFGVESYQ